MARCLLALGSNIGDRYAQMAAACSAIAQIPGCHLLSRSRWHATVPIGGSSGQGEFLNGAVLVDTTLSAGELAKALQQIELQLGRERIVRWDARTIDIDLLLYDDLILDTETLTVPHPRMAFRRFVLEPAADIAGAMLHPTSGWTIARLLTHLRDAPRLVAVTAVRHDLAEWLATDLGREMKCPTIAWQDGQKTGEQHSPTISERDIGSLSEGDPPAVIAQSPIEFANLQASTVAGTCSQRPAVVVWLDAAEPAELLAEVGFSGSTGEQTTDEWVSLPEPNLCGWGPVARITASDLATVRQEAQAALRCIWPDIP